MSKRNENLQEGEEKKVTLRSICDGSPNVARVFIYNSLDGIAFSVWNVSVVQLLIYRISGNSNGAVGWVSGVTGASQVFAALVGSHFADKGKRENITRIGAFCGMLGVMLSMIAAYFEEIALFYASAVLWGYYMGFSYPASEALFADSVASGQRTAIYSYKWAVGTLSYVFGYTINMVLFLAMGNHWHNSTIKIVVFCGLSLNPLSFMVLLSVRDKFSLGKESEGLLQGGGGGSGGGPRQEKEEGEQRLLISGVGSLKKKKTSAASVQKYGTTGAKTGEAVVKVVGDLSPHDTIILHDEDTSPTPPTRSSGSTKNSAAATTGADDEDQEEEEEAPGVVSVNPNTETSINASSPNTETDDAGSGTKEEDDGTNGDIDWNQSWLCFTTKQVPYLLVSADFISALGAGMTIRFFPLFFINVYNVNPAVLNAMYVVTMIATAGSATFIQRLAKTRVGRVPAMMLVRILGASALFYMAAANNLDGDAIQGVMLAVWVFRNSMMNSPLGLSRSVIMDHVPKSQRTKWNAVESFSSFTWAGSAVVGGYLVDAHGYKFTFGITATCQIVGALLIFPAAFLTRNVDVVAAKKFKQDKNTKVNS